MPMFLLFVLTPILRIMFLLFLWKFNDVGIMWGIKKYLIDENKIRLQIESNKKKKKEISFSTKLEEVVNSNRKREDNC